MNPKTARRLVISVVVLVALLVAADRISLVVSEHVAADSIKTSQNLDSTPSVSVGGFPFLSQLISGHYDEVDVHASGLEVDPSGRPLRVASVAVSLHGVHVSHGFSVFRADTARATARISYADLSHTLGSAVTYAGDGRVSASAGLTVAGVALRGSVSVRPVLTSSDALGFADVRVTALGVQAPEALTQLLSSIFAASIPLSALPFGLHFASIVATSSGVVVSLVGANVVYDSRSS